MPTLQYQSLEYLVRITFNNCTAVVVNLYSCIHAGPPNIKSGHCRQIGNNLHACYIGANFCIPDPSSRVNFWLDCFQDSTAPVTAYPLGVMWFLNGVLLTRIASPYIFIPSSASANMLRGNFTCQLTNTAGSDVATSIISNCSSK